MYYIATYYDIIMINNAKLRVISVPTEILTLIFLVQNHQNVFSSCIKFIKLKVHFGQSLCLKTTIFTNQQFINY